MCETRVDGWDAPRWPSGQVGKIVTLVGLTLGEKTTRPAEHPSEDGRKVWVLLELDRIETCGWVGCGLDVWIDLLRANGKPPAKGCSN